MPAAGAVVGAAATIGGAAIGASAQKKSAKSAANAQVETARMNNELAREFRGENTANLGPFVQRGDVAGAYYNALLGLPDSYYVERGPDGRPIMDPVNRPRPALPGGVNIPGGGFANIPGGAAQQGAQQNRVQRVSNVDAGRAFDAFRNSTGYNFRLNQGTNALNNLWAGRGALRSGAAGKSFMEYGQNLGSAEFGNYMGYLGGQQNIGLSAANALAGVGTNALAAMTANNQSAADARSNAALISGAANQQMWAGIGSGLGNLFGSSFGGGGGGLNQSIRTPSGMDALIAANLAS